MEAVGEEIPAGALEFVRQRNRLGRTHMEVSPIGFGASPLGGVFGGINEEDGVAAVIEAVRCGINYFDVSPFYGNTRAETVLGAALRQLPRESFYVSTKVGRYGGATFDFSAERVTRSVQESCERLGVDKLDLVLCHDIEFVRLDQIVSETIPALQKLKEAGKIGALGISGYPMDIFPYVMDSSSIPIDVVLSYCHHNLHDDALLRSFADLSRGGAVGVINASALSMGLLTDRGPPEWHPAPEALKDAARKAAVRASKFKSDLAAEALRYAILPPNQHAIHDHSWPTTTLIGIDSVRTLHTNLCTLGVPVQECARAAVLSAFDEVRNTTWPSGLIAPSE
mmetsp:Transcript_2221/g.5001  ORF Transcript_2221/g.5001 Transcript_2221/m.5001 type:complete len:339 (-) Transcript_2221:1612-2628(-)